MFSFQLCSFFLCFHLDIFFSKKENISNPLYFMNDKAYIPHPKVLKKVDFFRHRTTDRGHVWETHDFFVFFSSGAYF